MQFEYHQVDTWPALAWLARCRGTTTIEVWHGRRVETRADWFCEAAWPGPFEEGNFDETDLVTGTGVRLRGERVQFVASGNTVDRIVSMRINRALYVSNSVACLLGVSGAQIDRTYPRYYEDFASVRHGLAAYKRSVATTLGPISITTYGRLIWDGATAKTVHWDPAPRDFSTFAQYRSFLQNNLASLAANASERIRLAPFSLIATVSSGYDSPAVAALARDAGCAEALCIDRDRFDKREPCEEIADRLGMRTIVVPRDAWKDRQGAELPFIAADGTAEAVPLAFAASSLAGHVLLTGYHGDKVWAMGGQDLSANVVRGDSSGLSLSEFRLWAGFIHCPLPFWGARQIADIHRLSNSSEMRAWDVGGDYSRPIPRRIVESTGVPRSLFGVEKRAAAVGLTELLSPSSLDAYRAWLEDHRDEWIRRGRIPPSTSARFENLAADIRGPLESLLRGTPGLWRFASDNSIERPSRMRRHVFAWAVEQISQRYRMHFEAMTAPTGDPVPAFSY